MNDTSLQILSIKTLFKFPKSTSRPKIFSDIFPGFPDISGFLHHFNQRLQLLWSEPFEFFHDICVIVQLKQSGVEFHLLRKRECVDIAISDIAVHRVSHTFGYIVMRDSGVGEVCSE